MTFVCFISVCRIIRLEKTLFDDQQMSPIHCDNVQAAPIFTPRVGASACGESRLRNQAMTPLFNSQKYDFFQFWQLSLYRLRSSEPFWIGSFTVLNDNTTRSWRHLVAAWFGHNNADDSQSGASQALVSHCHWSLNSPALVLQSNEIGQLRSKRNSTKSAEFSSA